MNTACWPTILRRLAVGASLTLLASAPVARADFRDGMAKYTAHEYEAARAEFERLADLGDGPSQYNLGAMYLRGEGVPKDRATAVGWMLAAKENGYGAVAQAKLDAARAELPAEDRARVQAMLDRYGRKAVEARALPPDEGAWLACDVSAPGISFVPQANVGFSDYDGFVALSFVVGIDGLAHDPEVIISVPKGEFDYAALISHMNGRYVPATRDGKPVEMRTTMRLQIVHEVGGRLWNVGTFGRLQEAAAQEVPGAQYVVGVAGTLDASLGIDRDDASRMVLKAAQGGIPEAQYWVAREFDAGAVCRDAARHATWLEHAAAAGHPRAQVLFARSLLATGDGAAVERARALVRAAAGSDDRYALKHAIALALDPRLAPFDAGVLRDAASRLPPPRLRVDPLEDEVIAAAHAAGGRWSEAAAEETRALERATKYAWNTSAIAERLAAYRAQRTWTGDLVSVPPRDTPPSASGGREATICKGECKPRAPDEKRTKLGTRLPK